MWKLISKNNEEWFCHHLILSAPTPQSVKLLTEIKEEKYINKDLFLEIEKIHYTKALIGLVTLEEAMSIDPNGYIEFQNGPFFSLSDQSKKGVSNIPAITITMSPEFSEQEFDGLDESTLGKILKTFKEHYPMAKIKNAELKKWRYCQPLNQSKNLFLEIAPKIYLVGDAFGGSSLLGAVRSSEALCNFLLENKGKI